MTVTKLGKDIENGSIVELGFDARTSHIEVVGGTRSGKTTLHKTQSRATDYFEYFHFQEGEKIEGLDSRNYY